MRRKSLIFVLLMMCSFFAFAEENDTESMMTVEEAYLNSMEGVILKEMITSDGRDSKLVALQVIEEAVDSGRVSPELQKALGSLATVGLTSVVRENGRVANNYPDVRMRACQLLGKVKNEQSKDTLVNVMYTDSEPSVIMEAVKSLGELGYNDNDEVIELINFINRKFDIINPTSSLALEVLNAYEKLAPTVKNRQGMTDSILRISTNYNYITPVRTKAIELLRSIMATSGNGDSNKAKAESPKKAPTNGTKKK